MQGKNIRRTNKQRSETTRAALIAAARQLFVTKGYGGTGTPEIVARAKVTRGALYHHFDGKEGLFRCVVEAEAAAVALKVEAQSPRRGDPTRELLDGAKAFLAAVSTPGCTRLLLLDGPTILGRAEMDRIDRAHSARSLRDGLEDAMQLEVMQKLPLDALTSLLSAMFDRAALAIEQGEAPGDYATAISALLAGLGSD